MVESGKPFVIRKPFDMWLVPEDNDHCPREYIQVTYEGKEGKYAFEFARSELGALKEAIERWETEYYG